MRRASALRLSILAWSGALLAATSLAGSASSTIDDRWPKTEKAPPAKEAGRAVVTDFGATGQGIVDDTDAIQLAINSLAATGGVVHFPAGLYLVLGPLVLPHNGATFNTRQPPFAFTGTGAFFEGRNGGVPSGGSILNLLYAAGPKIATYGLGLFELSGITLADYGDDAQPFLYTTNTTLHVHDAGFFGSKPGVAAQNDAIVLGGTSAISIGGPSPNAPFQGYGTVIRDNYFNRVRRVVYGRVYANGVVVTGNTSWQQCGSGLPNGAAIELDGDPDGVTPQVNGGWYVAGNLIEVGNYTYGVKARESQRSAFIGNSFYDPTPLTAAYYFFEPSGKLNYVAAGFHDDNVPFVEDLATGVDRSTVLNFHQSQESLFVQPVRLTAPFVLESAGAVIPSGPRLRNPSGAELSYQMAGETGVEFFYTPEGGNAVDLWQVMDLGGGTIIQDLKGQDARLRNQNGSVKVQASPGSPAELGDTNGIGLRVNAGALTLTGSGVQILSGSGAPTAAAPDGSLYLRTDGAAGTTLYVRTGGVWVAK